MPLLGNPGWWAVHQAVPPFEGASENTQPGQIRAGSTALQARSRTAQSCSHPDGVGLPGPGPRILGWRRMGRALPAQWLEEVDQLSPGGQPQTAGWSGSLPKGQGPPCPRQEIHAPGRAKAWAGQSLSTQRLPGVCHGGRLRRSRPGRQPGQGPPGLHRSRLLHPWVQQAPGLRCPKGGPIQWGHGLSLAQAPGGLVQPTAAAANLLGRLRVRRLRPSRVATKSLMPWNWRYTEANRT